MLFETVGQFWVALLFLWCGFFLGLIDQTVKAMQFRINRPVFVPVFDILRALMFGASFFLCSQFALFGQIRMYAFLIFIAGFLIERKILCNLVAKLFIILYNYSVNKVKNRKEKLKYAKNRK